MYVVLENERCPIAVCVVSGVNLRAHSLSLAHTQSYVFFARTKHTHTALYSRSLSLSLGYCLFVNVNEQSIAVVRLVVVVVVADFI